METFIASLTSANLMALATDPRVIFLAVVVFIAAVLMRWKFVLLILFGVGGVLTIARYSHLAGGFSGLDRNLLLFAGGTLLVAVVLIYFLFIKGD